MIQAQVIVINKTMPEFNYCNLGSKIVSHVAVSICCASRGQGSNCQKYALENLKHELYQISKSLAELKKLANCTCTSRWILTFELTLLSNLPLLRQPDTVEAFTMLTAVFP